MHNIARDLSAIQNVTDGNHLRTLPAPRPRAEQRTPQRANLILHSGGTRATFEQVAAVSVPKHTQTWKPMSYAEMIGYVKDVIDRRLGAPIESEAYGLNKAGDQMFGLITLDVGDEATGLSIGLRSSYNKSIAPAVACGAQVFVCDNLCFSGSAFEVVRRNTKNVWADFRALVSGHVAEALGHYEAVNADGARMADVPVNLRRGYEILGVALGEGVLTPTQASVAFGDWTEARHDEFIDRNLWSLYNCATEGLKKGAPARTIDRHTRAHDFFTALAN